MTKKPAAEKAVSAVKKPRAVRPPATRVTSTRRHTKAVAVSPEASIETVVIPQENPHEAIAKIAYGYWEGRGYQGGSPTEDWFRAEFEYQGREAAL